MQEELIGESYKKAIEKALQKRARVFESKSGKNCVSILVELGVVGFIHNSLLYIDPRSRRMYV
jgi:hypothetical protein